jgi:hypothetical protein
MCGGNCVSTVLLSLWLLTSSLTNSDGGSTVLLVNDCTNLVLTPAVVPNSSIHTAIPTAFAGSGRGGGQSRFGQTTLSVLSVVWPYQCRPLPDHSLLSVAPSHCIHDTVDVDRQSIVPWSACRWWQWEQMNSGVTYPNTTNYLWLWYYICHHFPKFHIFKYVINRLYHIPYDYRRKFTLDSCTSSQWYQ